MSADQKIDFLLFLKNNFCLRFSVSVNPENVRGSENESERKREWAKKERERV